MGFCIDNSTKFLKGIGYNVVRLPREGIEPLQIIGVQRGEPIQLGSLRDLLIDPQPLPNIDRDEVATGISGQRSSDLSAALGLNVLGSILGAMGAGGVKAQYQNAKTVTFEYVDVRSDSVSPLLVGSYLREATVDVENKIVQQYVLGNGSLYLITRTIRSNTFTVEAKAKGGGGVELDVPVIQQAVGGNVKVEANSSNSGVVTYRGEKSLVFGFQCFNLGIRDGVVTLTNTPAGGQHMDAVAEQKQASILSSDGLLDLG